jgi:hypothetical protein
MGVNRFGHGLTVTFIVLLGLLKSVAVYSHTLNI